ncbi:anhydro-N-acetylmuramic acid kinase [Aquicella lusitana]|uniref:Anhydro-N-acetylmuramic acid kinase n=1 Tax=Aquicella lusitana TaxID=254246 RepID=A0A370GEN1_9COXI|nr:anhydro-N-acetylmuramic acid kinase [Aquicella lusitana]RDI41720.1 anhydro-N-acetylmuramic acid kinase [Aquicella lusitana]VVC72696.1 Anhydro-N-acetylmuramic acid kinase [Aquicella lusitana]
MTESKADTEFYIGLMSGTSADGIDAALVDFETAIPRVIATHYAPYSQAIRDQILALCQRGEDEIERLGELDVILGQAFAQAANDLLKQHAISAASIKAIGSHGQTIRHYPDRPYRFSLQIGDPNTIASLTGITTIADFRRKDMAFGGQGAPLVPAFHQQVLASTDTNRVIVNIGGIANITLLAQAKEMPVFGFDTGPGNILMDAWIEAHHQATYDQQGKWGKQGNVHADLVKQMLSDPYFHLPPPKSTGREYFNSAWLHKQLLIYGKAISAVDVQATLAELTAVSILEAIQRYFSSGEILVCGGGAHNAFLMQRMQTLAAPHFTVASTKAYGIDPDWMEATAFAWLAKQTLHRQPGNLPSVTGAKQAAILGGIYYSA